MSQSEIFINLKVFRALPNNFVPLSNVRLKCETILNIGEQLCAFRIVELFWALLNWSYIFFENF